jgi:peroxiredoxin
MAVNAGDLAPDFELLSLDGEAVRLSDYRGKRLVLFMWASW